MQKVRLLISVQNAILVIWKIKKNEPDYSALHTVSAGDNSHHYGSGRQQKKNQTKRARNSVKRQFCS